MVDLGTGKTANLRHAGLATGMSATPLIIQRFWLSYLVVGLRDKACLCCYADLQLFQATILYVQYTLSTQALADLVCTGCT